MPPNSLAPRREGATRGRHRPAARRLGLRASRSSAFLSFRPHKKKIRYVQEPQSFPTNSGIVPAMRGFVCAGTKSHSWSCITSNQTLAPPPPRFLGSPAGHLFALVAAAAAALLIWFRRNPVPLGDEFLGRAAIIPAPEELPQGQRHQELQQIRPIAEPPQLPDEQSLPMWDRGQAAAAIDAIRTSLDDQIRPDPPRRPRRRADSSDSDSSGSDNDRNKQLPYWSPELIRKYPRVADLDAGDAILIAPNSLVQLQEGFSPLPESARLEMLPRFTRRFSDVIENQWILHTNSDFGDPCEESDKILVRKSKITTKFLCLLWRQLNEQDCQLCQELKESYFAEVAGPCIDILLDVAYSLSKASWTAGNMVLMMPIFDALVDVLCNIWDMSFTRSEFIHNKICNIFRIMVNTLGGVLEETANNTKGIESDIHAATSFLIRVLVFFHLSRDMLQAILGSADHTMDFHNCWVSKIEGDAKLMFQHEQGRQYIFILNNIYFVWQKKSYHGGFLSNEHELISLIEQYVKRYLDECWIPLVTFLEGDSRGVDKFNGEFESICDRQMKWKVQTELKKTLREKITDLIIPPYRKFLLAQPATPSKASLWLKKLVQHNRKKNKVTYTVEQLENAIGALFER